MKVGFAVLIVLVLFQNCLSSQDVTKTHCGNIFSDREFILSSENYPHTYPSRDECFYLLKGTNCTTHFLIEFLDFELKDSVGCTVDRLEIGHQDALCGHKNGTKLYYAEKGELKLKFIFDKEADISYKGFKVLIKRIDGCENSSFNSLDIDNTEEMTTEEIQYEWTTKIKVPLKPTYLPPASEFCCQNNLFSSKNFYLASPNFPYSMNTPKDCIYIIKKANSRICRLRLNLLYFSLGEPTEASCPNGYLLIKNKFICGCNSNIKLVTEFQESNSIVLRFYTPGYKSAQYSGFLLDVTQDECPKRYSPEHKVIAKRFRSFRHYNDQFNRVLWPQRKRRSIIEQLKLIDERIDFEPTDNNSKEKQLENVYRHFYFFAPDEQRIEPKQYPHDKEETNYIEISTINTILTNYYDYVGCTRWNDYQFNYISRRFGSRFTEMCKATENSIGINKNCIELNLMQGSFQSPRYPSNYPENQNICYRFQLLPGNCYVEILFKDFFLEDSFDCQKDYLALENQQRFCGQYLLNKVVTIRPQGNLTEDVNFVSDASYCGRGFSAVYRQIPCKKPNDQLGPLDCIPDEGKSLSNCDRIIEEKSFTINGPPRNDKCVFQIKKYSDDVCQIQLYFLRFHLPCSIGSITINGQNYCGEQTGKLVTIDITDQQIITYSKIKYYPTNYQSGEFIIEGKQLSENCGDYYPPIARSSLGFSKRNDISLSGELPEKQVWSDALPEVCALIKANVTVEQLPTKICQLIKKYDQFKNCNLTQVTILDRTAEEHKPIKVRLFDGLTNLAYKEFECNYIK